MANTKFYRVSANNPVIESAILDLNVQVLPLCNLMVSANIPFLSDLILIARECEPGTNVGHNYDDSIDILIKPPVSNDLINAVLEHGGKKNNFLLTLRINQEIFTMKGECIYTVNDIHEIRQQYMQGGLDTAPIKLIAYINDIQFEYLSVVWRFNNNTVTIN